GEAAGRGICLVDTPGWSRSILHTPEKIKNEVIRSVHFCPPGPHALILVLRVKSLTELPSVKQLKTASRHMELLSERVWKHTMVLFLCDEDVEDPTVEANIQKANKLLEKCGNRHYVLRSEALVSEFLQEIDKMVEENCVDFFLPQVYYEYCQTRIKEAEEAVIRRRRGNVEGLRHISQIGLCHGPDMALGALIGLVAGSVYGVMGSRLGIVIGAVVTVPLALWLIGSACLAKEG
ncbi:GTPase IMAP family member 9-like, partial [Colossoma macropomum]|uniref:GTPase IMAP family member 9-like n=1 Tax=Colossoma macropomum TaxID=42526 RepID=UPI0018641C49